MSDNWKWLETTDELQTKSFGVSPSTLKGAAAAEYARWNTLAAIDELMEALHEVDWKPWTVTEDGIRNPEAFKGELVDVGHFLGNLCRLVGMTDEEWAELYQVKQQKNRDRMASKTYDGRNKCPNCARAYDDESTKCTPGTLTGSALTAYTCHEKDGNVVVSINKETWEPVLLGTNIAIGDTVRVKTHAYADKFGDTHNGQVGTLAQVINGQCLVRYEDGSEHVHVPARVEKRKH